MNEKNNPKLRKKSQELRKNMTEQERHLWYEFLKEYPVIFKRQKVIGKYIVDFYCPSKQIVVEIDGTQHFLDGGKAKDQERDAYLRSSGLTVLRYSNYEINTAFDAVCEDIIYHSEGKK